LYRFGGDDRPFAVLEPGLEELRTIRAAADGSLFIVALTAGGEPAEGSGVTGSVTITVGGTTTGTSSTSAPASEEGRRSVIYSVSADGTWDSLWSTTDAIYDLALRDASTVLVATGPEGRLYQVSSAPATWGAAALINTVDAKQVTRLAVDGARTLAATANPGRVAAIGSAPATSPSYVSPVRDAKTLAQWGSIRWEGAGTVSLQTRSGNTESPDDSWSVWAAPASGNNGLAIASPPARFLQWRVALTPGTVAPVVTSVTVAYLPRNLRPAVTAVTVHPPGVVFQRPFSSEEGAIAGLDAAIADARRPPGGEASNSGGLGRRMFQRGLQTLEWKAEDPDGDRLRYQLHYRREGEVPWRLLRDELQDPLFVWDTTSVPDGRYVVRIQAADALRESAMLTLIAAYGGLPLDTRTDPPTVNFSDPATVNALQQVLDLVKNGYISYAAGGPGG
jgi:hypothetical protein